MLPDALVCLFPLHGMQQGFLHSASLHFLSITGDAEQTEGNPRPVTISIDVVWSQMRFRVVYIVQGGLLKFTLLIAHLNESDL